MAKVRVNGRFVPQVMVPAAKALNAAGFVYLRAIQEKLAGQRSGIRYKVPGTKGTYYTASAPGEPPAVRLGDLRKRAASQLGSAGEEVVIRFGSNVPYAKMLETGTSKIAPRPAWRPTMREKFPEVLRQFSRTMVVELKKAGGSSSGGAGA